MWSVPCHLSGLSSPLPAVTWQTANHIASSVVLKFQTKEPPSHLALWAQALCTLSITIKAHVTPPGTKQLLTAFYQNWWMLTAINSLEVRRPQQQFTIVTTEFSPFRHWYKIQGAWSLEFSQARAVQLLSLQKKHWKWGGGSVCRSGPESWALRNKPR